MKKMTVLLVGMCLILCSCSYAHRKYPANYGDAIWVADCFDAYMDVKTGGGINTEYGKMTIDGIETEVMYGFVPGWFYIGYWDEGNQEYYKKGYSCAMNTRFCSGDIKFARDHQSFSVKIVESDVPSIPLGTVITFTRQ